jgi:hypothetical protein
MPACPVEHHHGMFVLSQRSGKAAEESLHRRRIGVRHDERERVIGARFDGGEDIGEGEALIAKARRPLAPFPPDAGLVLEKQPQALVFIRTLNFLEKRRSSF